ncbi:25281_t:CDS:2, partial [Racocetra persica]
LSWVIFNAIFAMLFGGLHQAGIIPVIQRLQHEAIGFRNCEEYEGYVRCDIGKRIIRPGTSVQVNIHDLSGRPIRILETLLLKQVSPKKQLITPYLRHIYFQQRFDGNITLRQYERTLLVTPSTTDLSIFEEPNPETKKIELVLVDKYWPHLNFDYFDRVFRSGMYLNVYAVVQG